MSGLGSSIFNLLPSFASIAQHWMPESRIEASKLKLHKDKFYKNLILNLIATQEQYRSDMLEKAPVRYGLTWGAVQLKNILALHSVYCAAVPLFMEFYYGFTQENDESQKGKYILVSFLVSLISRSKVFIADDVAVFGKTRTEFDATIDKSIARYGSGSLTEIWTRAYRMKCVENPAIQYAFERIMLELRSARFKCPPVWNVSLGKGTKCQGYLLGMLPIQGFALADEGSFKNIVISSDRVVFMNLKELERQNTIYSRRLTSSSLTPELAIYRFAKEQGKEIVGLSAPQANYFPPSRVYFFSAYDLVERYIAGNYKGLMQKLSTNMPNESLKIIEAVANTGIVVHSDGIRCTGDRKYWDEIDKIAKQVISGEGQQPQYVESDGVTVKVVPCLKTLFEENPKEKTTVVMDLRFVIDESGEPRASFKKANISLTPFVKFVEQKHAVT